MLMEEEDKDAYTAYLNKLDITLPEEINKMK
jgi:hypothetical protein